MKAAWRTELAQLGSEEAREAATLGDRAAVDTRLKDGLRVQDKLRAREQGLVGRACGSRHEAEGLPSPKEIKKKNSLSILVLGQNTETAQSVSF